MHFVLYSDKIPVDGAERSAICDLERKRYTLIPNALYEILTTFYDRTPQEIGKLYQAPDLIKDYFTFLEREGLGFFTKNPAFFPQIPLEWNRPEKILVAEIQVKDGFEDHHLKGLDELERVQCKHVEIAAEDPLPIEEIESLFSLFSGSAFRTIDLLTPFHPAHPLDRTLRLKEKTPEFNILVFHEAPENISNKEEHVFWTPKGLKELKSKEDPPFQQLILNKEFFLESLEHNPYYNRKVSIDEEGNIKNAIEQERSFGKVGEQALETVIERADFQELWYASNDRIEDVMDWELRFCWFNTHPLERLENGNYRILWT